jgi:uncharacterized protein YdbL (DUF1318 family)
MGQFKTLVPLACALLTSCTFNFELTSQRTALENQVLGSYKEIEDELILVSAVRGQTLAAKASENASDAAMARKNQDFNRDDIEEFKESGIIGEVPDGTISLTNLPSPKNTAAMSLARELIKEENSDRSVIWDKIIKSNKNLSLKDLPEVRKTYAKMIRDRAPAGQLFLDDGKSWIKK